MDAVEEIKGRLAVEDVVGRYVDLKRSGASLKGLCPFHQEKTPSFYVTPSRGSYHCFGCGKGGDIFSFVMELERLPFPEALRQLAEQAGVQLPEYDAGKPSLKGQLYDLNEEAARFFRAALGTSSGARARGYLQERGFDEAACERFELGYAPDARDILVRRLTERGSDATLLLAAGLAVGGDDGQAPRDRFRNRLMFPIRDAAGRIAGFGGRLLGEGQPKYLNSPQTEIFDKSAVLYGIHLAGGAMKEAGKAVLVEGYLDAVRAQRAGFTATVASLGTAVTVPQLTALSRLTDTVILALDPDAAGQHAAARAAIVALAEVTQNRSRAAGSTGRLDLRIARLPEGLGDRDELIRDHPDRWQSTIDAAVPAFEFFFRQSIDELDRGDEGWRQAAIDRLLPLIQQFADSTAWQAQWLEQLARETGVGVQALQRSLAPGRGSRRPAPRRESREAAPDIVAGTTSRALGSDPVTGVERALLALLLRLVVVPPEAADVLAEVELQRSEHRDILAGILAWAPSGNYEYPLLREELPEGVRDLTDELYARDVPLPEDDKITVAVAFHLARLHRFQVQAQVQRIQRMLGDLAAADSIEAVAALGQLLKQRGSLDQELHELSRLAPAAQGTIDQDSGKL